MDFQLKQLFIGENVVLPIEGEIDLTALEYDQTHPFVEPVKVSGAISNSSGVIRLSYHVEFPFRKPCDRCAEETTHQYAYSFEHILVDELSGPDVGEYVVLEDYRLDLDELATSDILLELPMKFLCSENCKGLCPQCGVNRNIATCNCSTQKIDPRLEILRSLIK